MSDNIDERASEILTEKVSRLALVLESLGEAWFPSIIDLDIEGTLRGFAIWKVITEDLEELVTILHDKYGEGRSLEEDLLEQIKRLEAEAQEFEKMFERLEGLRQNAENN